MLNRNHIYSSLPKQAVNPAPPNLHASTYRKNGEMLHSLGKGKDTDQIKHNSQNILGCAHLSALVKTSSFNDNIKYLLCVLDILTKYALFKKSKTVLDGFIEKVKESKRKQKKLWVGQKRFIT